MADVLAIETLATLILVGIYILLSVYTTKFSEQNFWFHCVHESGICILLGMLIGGMYIWTSDHSPQQFEASLFFHFMLPFLFFGIGYNMKRRRFFRNFAPIILNGVLGTFLNFILLTILSWSFIKVKVIDDYLGGIDLNFKDSLAIGAVLSCPEMIVTLSVIRDTTNPKLHSILLGESLLGGAISISIINSINLVDKGEGSFTAANFFKFIGLFFYSLIGSLVIGVVLGFCSALMTKKFTQIKNVPNKEVALQFYIGWTGYILAAMINCAGLLSILVCAVITSHYAWYNMNTDSKTVVIETFRAFGEGARALFFCYLGLTALSYSPGKLSALLLFLLFISIAVTRLLTTFGLPLILKLFKKKYEYNVKNLAIIWLGGLFRGTITFGLILSISINHSETVRVTVLYIVIISMILYTFILPFWVRWLAPVESIDRNQSIMEALADGYYRDSYLGNSKLNFQLLEETAKKKRSWFHEKWRYFDNMYFKPCFIDAAALAKLSRNKRRLETARNTGISLKELMEEDEEEVSQESKEKH